MGSRNRDVGHKLLAVLVMLAMLFMMGIPPTVIFFFATVVYFVWRAVDRSEQHETRRVFEFYLAANEILRDDERRLFAFEIGEVLHQGEDVLHSMKDAPPLLHYTLGALYHRHGEYEAAVEHLAFVRENEAGDERHFAHPSPELRRYVAVLRRLEREPADGPQTIAAVRSLERARRVRAELLLAESREQIERAAAANAAVQATHAHSTALPPPQGDFTNGVAPEPNELPFKFPQANGGQRSVRVAAASPDYAATPPPVPQPITEVLRDLYAEEKKTA